jgi:hypothetical protein
MPCATCAANELTSGWSCSRQKTTELQTASASRVEVSASVVAQNVPLAPARSNRSRPPRSCYCMLLTIAGTCPSCAKSYKTNAGEEHIRRAMFGHRRLYGPFRSSGGGGHCILAWAKPRVFYRRILGWALLPGGRVMISPLMMSAEACTCVESSMLSASS